jgi:hypothetical protein
MPSENFTEESFMDRPISRRGMFIIYLIIGLFTVAPILSVVIAASIAGACGCKLDEGDAHPCIVLGVDIGGVLYAMGLAVWLIPITLPIGLLTFWAFAHQPQKEKSKHEA